MKSVLIGWLLSFCIIHVNAQNQQIEADYFLFVNLSEQKKTDPTGTVTVGPLSLYHVVDVNLPGTERFSSIVIEWSSDNRHWALKRIIPLTYSYAAQSGRGLGLEAVTAEEAAFFKAHKTLFARLSFFSSAGVFAGETIQKRIAVQDIENGRAYKVGKGVLAWEAKKKPKTK